MSSVTLTKLSNHDNLLGPLQEAGNNYFMKMVQDDIHKATGRAPHCRHSINMVSID